MYCKECKFPQLLISFHPFFRCWDYHSRSPVIEKAFSFIGGIRNLKIFNKMDYAYNYHYYEFKRNGYYGFENHRRSTNINDFLEPFLSVFYANPENKDVNISLKYERYYKEVYNLLK